MSENIHALVMPKLGLTMKEGTVAAWRVAVDKEVKEGEPVADIETAKITAEYESPCAGVLRRQVAASGSVSPVGALIGVVALPDVSDAEIDSFIQAFKPDTPS